MIAGVLICIAAALHAQPTQAQLQQSLQDAQAAWGVTITWPVEVRLEPFPNDCQVKKGHRTLATTEWQGITSGIDGGEKTTAWRYAVKLNAACDWAAPNDYYSLDRVMVHEVGHILLTAAWHSKDKHSVMYATQEAGQQITAEDRAKLAQTLKP